MLERASTCLESGGQQLLRAPKRCVRSRRMLHSSFWHHGASDLALPLWWASALAEQHPAGDTGKPRGQRSNDALFLDFLFPEKTLALLRGMTITGWKSLQGQHGLRNIGNGTRRFSTNGNGLRIDSTAYRGAGTLQQEVEDRLAGSSAVDALRELIDSGETGKQEVAWRLYAVVQQPTPEVRADFLDFLGPVRAPFDASRMLKIFNTLSHEYRRASLYQMAISAHVSMQMVGSAIELHEEAAKRLDIGLDFGTHHVLVRTIQDSQWDLTFRIWHTFMHRVSLEKKPELHWRPKGKLRRAIWGSISEVPDLKSNLVSCLQYYQQFKHDFQPGTERDREFRIFLSGFLPKVTQQTLTAKPPDEDTIWNFFVNLFTDLRMLGLSTNSFYVTVLGQMLSLERYREYTNKKKIFLEIYRQYREEMLADSRLELRSAPRTGEDPGPEPFRPPVPLLRRMLHQVGSAGSFDGVVGILKDWSLFQKGMQPCLEDIEYILDFFAEVGDAERVFHYFDELRRRYPSRITLRVLSTLLFVYARRVDVSETNKQFERITQEFGLEPDVVCWNILLLAYARADDMEGSLKCFNRMLESGTIPDDHTFGPLLNLCAGRGDVEAFEAIFSQAEELRVPLVSDAVARTGYVQACLNSGDPEGAETITEGMLASYRAGTLHGPLTPAYNIIIQHYALAKDVASCRRMYKEMMKNGVSLDAWTYGGLMRSLIELGQTNAAYKILRVTMPKNKIQVQAYHYAIVMVGFLRERQYDQATKAYERMVRRQVLQTPTSNIAALEVIGMNELRQLRTANNEDPRTRLVEVERALRDIMLASNRATLSLRQPYHRRMLENPHQQVPDGYFGLLVLLYTTRGAYEICNELFEAARSDKSDEQVYEAPIGLLTAIMEAHLKAGEHGEVAKCWQLARSQADKLTKTWGQASKDPEAPKATLDSVTDQSIMAQASAAHIATNRRQILFMSTRIYLRSLVAQGTPQSLQQGMRTITDLLTSGYVIDGLTWNEFVQALAQRGRVADAFTICETYLMPKFPGWREVNPYLRRNDRFGYTYMDVRHDDLSRGSILPRYRTLVFLAASYAQIKREEASGIGYHVEEGKWQREVLEQRAPKTVRAIETMPRTGDAMQRRYLL
ncbi:hypothetical protein BCR34DRAFT_553895 [Clohesyomyces aquaticus]|uniref:Pentacotripeptide-repeat region of PRORP domain-containing protein n=1 Tax=Clohesyomyces aquaticus TaxID=1231657 RepID=A0A1Y2A7Y1_9PLEO|nr:hypothetical protein BCR34DRAFT_553895 [Clohesyomyces aquaticus]